MTSEERRNKLQNAEALMEVFSKIPEQRQPLFAAMVECMLVGADLAQARPAALPPSKAERPGA